MKKFLPLLAGLFLIGGAGTTLANDQIAVIGFGGGVISFAEDDEIRNPSGSASIDEGARLDFFGEWYLMGDLGLGLRSLAAGGSRTTTGTSIDVTEYVTVGANLVTFQWIVAGSQDYTRWGIEGGYGQAVYQYAYDGYILGTNVDESFETTGTATLGGVFFDWGGDIFGARFMVDYLKTDFDDLDVNGTKFKVDGSGTSWHFDLRWAWRS